MADFEDSTAPTWFNVLDGQMNLIMANNRSIDFKDPKSGKTYALKENPATLLVRFSLSPPIHIFRPRGWHLEEVCFFCN